MHAQCTLGILWSRTRRASMPSNESFAYMTRRCRCPTGTSEIHSRLNLISVFFVRSPCATHSDHGNHHRILYPYMYPNLAGIKVPSHCTVTKHCRCFVFNKIWITAALNAILITPEPFQNSLLCVMRQIFGFDARFKTFFFHSSWPARKKLLRNGFLYETRNGQQRRSRESLNFRILIFLFKLK